MYCITTTRREGLETLCTNFCHQWLKGTNNKAATHISNQLMMMTSLQEHEVETHHTKADTCQALSILQTRLSALPYPQKMTACASRNSRNTSETLTLELKPELYNCLTCRELGLSYCALLNYCRVPIISLR
jgi:hypothetical protein